MGRIRVCVVDDQTLVRRGLRRILESDTEIEVAGEAADGRSAVELAEKVTPHVVLMDIALPELNGLEATRRIAKPGGDVHVLILATQADDTYVRQSIQAGARGYLLTDADESELLKAVKAVGRGGSFFSPAAASVLLEDARSHHLDDSLSRLTDREREVLQLIAEGRTNKEIAGRLTVSVNTVESHRKHIMEKLNLHNTAAIVRFAIRKRIVTDR
jgi:two-component system response regulator NreC